jgi:hypothetical protein
MSITKTGSILILVILMCNFGCDKKSPTEGDSKIKCGSGSGYSVDFCKQVDHYEAGFGVAGLDYIVVECLAGPKGATVSNQTNGTYYCSGVYKLTTYDHATISLNWGGTTQYTATEEFEIESPGNGTFSLTVTKKSGGAGNIFLSMASDWRWMFDTVLVNEDCGHTKTNLIVIQPREMPSVSKSDAGKLIEKQKPIYRVDRRQ